MAYILASVGLLAVLAGLSAWYYKSKAKSATERADDATLIAHNNAEVAQELGTRLKDTLDALRKAQMGEAEEDHEEAAKVTDAAGAAAFLGNSVRPGSESPGARPKARVPAAYRAHRARFVPGFAR